MYRLATIAIATCAVCLINCAPRVHREEMRLPVPEELTSNVNATEIASIWEDGQHQTFLFGEPAGWSAEHWGLLTADFLRHAAKSNAAASGKSEAETLASMKKAFDAEWENPTTEIAEGIK